MFPPYVPEQSKKGEIPLVQGVIESPSSSLPHIATGNVVTAATGYASAPPHNPHLAYHPPSQQLQAHVPAAHPSMGHAQGYAHASQHPQPPQQPHPGYGQQQCTYQQQPLSQPHYIQQPYPQQHQTTGAGTLADTKRLIVRQKFESLEAFAHAAANAVNMSALGNLGEIANRYDVFSGDGGDKYRVLEQSEYFGLTGRCCCNPNHQLKLHVYASESFNNTNELMVFDRPCKCGRCCACCDLCRQEMVAYDGGSARQQIGYIKQPFLGGGFSPALQVMDRDGEEPYATIEAEAVCCIAGLCCDHTFVVKDARGNRIGKIVKLKPDGLAQLSQELVSDADVFSIEFRDVDLDVDKKATLFGALHLIDYMFFENEGDGAVDVVNRRGACKLCDLYCCGCVVPCTCRCGHGGDGGSSEVAW